MLAICAALRWEIQPVLRAVRGAQWTKCGSIGIWTTQSPQPIVVFRTGIGRASAERTTRHVLNTLPIRTIINTGCAGALTRALSPGAVVVPHLILDVVHEPHEVDDNCAGRLKSAARQAALPFVEGSILTSSTVLTTAVAKRLAHTRFGATAVEMEGHAVASVAREHSVRFGSARAILDGADLDLPENTARTTGDPADPRQQPPFGSLANGVNAAQTSLERLFRHFLATAQADEENEGMV